MKNNENMKNLRLIYPTNKSKNRLYQLTKYLNL